MSAHTRRDQGVQFNVVIAPDADPALANNAFTAATSLQQQPSKVKTQYQTTSAQFPQAQQLSGVPLVLATQETVTPTPSPSPPAPSPSGSGGILILILFRFYIGNVVCFSSQNYEI